MEWTYYGLDTTCGPAPQKKVEEGTGQMQMSPCIVLPTGLQPTCGRIWLHIFGDHRGRTTPTLYLSSLGLGFAFLSHNQKSSKTMQLELLSVPVLSDIKLLTSR